MGKDDFGWPVAVLVESPLGVGKRPSLLFPVLYQEAADFLPLQVPGDS
jgi:hypothetical protein